MSIQSSNYLQFEGKYNENPTAIINVLLEQINENKMFNLIHLKQQ